MKKSFVILTAICLFFFGIFSLYAQEEKLRIAVIDFTALEKNYSGAQEITSTLTTELVNTEKYRVVERAQIEKILKEQGLQSTQMASAQAVELGKLLGVRKIITGEYSGLNYSENQARGGSTSVRLIDVETGDIEAAITFKNAIFNKKGKWQRHMSMEEIAKKIISELL